LEKAMSKLYYNLHLLDNEEGAVATTTDDHEFEEYFELLKRSEFKSLFTVKEGLVEDYLANDLGWPLMSERMKDIFQKFTSVDVHWVKSKVYDKRIKRNHSYHIPVFKSKCDTVNVKESSFDSSGLILVPVFSLAKISKMDFFPQPDEYDFNLVVSQEVKLAMEQAKITGIDFSEAQLSE
jgi:hypothetical protein